MCLLGCSCQDRGVWMLLHRCGAGWHLSLGAESRCVGFAAAALVACQLVAGCGSSGSGGSGSGGSRAPSGSAVSCEGIVEFDLPEDNPNPHGATPRQALNAFLARGSVHGSVPPSLGPVKAGYPASGWRQVKASSDKAVFTSGSDELDFTRNGNGSWVITGGRKSC